MDTKDLTPNFDDLETSLKLPEDVIATPNEGTPVRELVSRDKLLEAGTYFGHQSHMWNPKMKPYIHTKKGRNHIIDLVKTKKTLEYAYDLINKMAQKNASFIFVGTRKQASETIKENALRANAFYVNTRWLGGIITNHATIRNRVYRMLQLEKMQESNFEGYTKKEAIGLTKELEKLQRNLTGIKEMKKLPNIMIIADPMHDQIAVMEARKKGIKVFGIVDTNVDPNLVDFVIPANDDSKKSVTLIITLLADAIVEAKGGDLKYAFKPNDEIILPIEIKRKRPEHTFDRRRKFVATDENDQVVQELEAQAGKKQIEEMDDLEKLKLNELKQKAKLKEIKGYTSMTKHELIEAIQSEQGEDE